MTDSVEADVKNGENFSAECVEKFAERLTESIIDELNALNLLNSTSKFEEEQEKLIKSEPVAAFCDPETSRDPVPSRDPDPSCNLEQMSDDIDSSRDNVDTPLKEVKEKIFLSSDENLEENYHSAPESDEIFRENAAVGTLATAQKEPPLKTTTEIDENCPKNDGSRSKIDENLPKIDENLHKSGENSKFDHENLHRNDENSNYDEENLESNFLNRRRRSEVEDDQGEENEEGDAVISPTQKSKNRDYDDQSGDEYFDDDEETAGNDQQNQKYANEAAPEADREENNLHIKDSACDEVESEVVNGERERGDGEEVPESPNPTSNNSNTLTPAQPSKKPEEIEDRKNPTFVPKRGVFYEHDLRDPDSTAASNDVATAQAAGGKKPHVTPPAANQKWRHDMFDLDEQSPKSRQELIDTYGYDIRNESKAPMNARNRRYGRAPKRIRDWRNPNSYHVGTGRGFRKNSNNRRTRSTSFSKSKRTISNDDNGNTPTENNAAADAVRKMSDPLPPVSADSTENARTVAAKSAEKPPPSKSATAADAAELSSSGGKRDKFGGTAAAAAGKSAAAKSASPEQEVLQEENFNNNPSSSYRDRRRARSHERPGAGGGHGYGDGYGYGRNFGSRRPYNNNKNFHSVRRFNTGTGGGGYRGSNYDYSTNQQYGRGDDVNNDIPPASSRDYDYPPLGGGAGANQQNYAEGGANNYKFGKSQSASGRYNAEAVSYSSKVRGGGAGGGGGDSVDPHHHHFVKRQVEHQKDGGGSRRSNFDAYQQNTGGGGNNPPRRYGIMNREHFFDGTNNQYQPLNMKQDPFDVAEIGKFKPIPAMEFRRSVDKDYGGGTNQKFSSFGGHNFGTPAQPYHQNYQQQQQQQYHQNQPAYHVTTDNSHSASKWGNYRQPQTFSSATKSYEPPPRFKYGRERGYSYRNAPPISHSYASTSGGGGAMDPRSHQSLYASSGGGGVGGGPLNVSYEEDEEEGLEEEEGGVAGGGGGDPIGSAAEQHPMGNEDVVEVLEEGDEEEQDEGEGDYHNNSICSSYHESEEIGEGHFQGSRPAPPAAGVAGIQQTTTRPATKRYSALRQHQQHNATTGAEGGVSPMVVSHVTSSSSAAAIDQSQTFSQQLLQHQQQQQQQHQQHHQMALPSLLPQSMMQQPPPPPPAGAPSFHPHHHHMQPPPPPQFLAAANIGPQGMMHPAAAYLPQMAQVPLTYAPPQYYDDYQNQIAASPPGYVPAGPYGAPAGPIPVPVTSMQFTAAAAHHHHQHHQAAAILNAQQQFSMTPEGTVYSPPMVYYSPENQQYRSMAPPKSRPKSVIPIVAPSTVVSGGGGGGGASGLHHHSSSSQKIDKEASPPLVAPPGDPIPSPPKIDNGGKNLEKIPEKLREIQENVAETVTSTE